MKKGVFVMTAAAVLSSCGGGGSGQQMEWSPAAQEQRTATGVALGQTELGTPTKPSVEYLRIRPSGSIFLDPPEVDDPAIFLRVRDSSGQNFDLHEEIKKKVENFGYRITPNAADATYIVQANVRLAQEVSALEKAKLDETKYGQDPSKIVKSVVKGAALGAGAGVLAGDSGKAALAGGVAGGILGGIIASSDESARQKRIKAKQGTKFYSVLVDIEIRERIKDGELRRQVDSSESLAEGATVQDGETFAGSSVGARSSSGASTQIRESYSETSEWKSHSIRIIGEAKGKLIAFADVHQDLAVKLADSIANLL